MASNKDIAKSKSHEALGLIPYQDVETKTVEGLPKDVWKKQQ